MTINKVVLLNFKTALKKKIRRDFLTNQIVRVKDAKYIISMGLLPADLFESGQ